LLYQLSYGINFQIRSANIQAIFDLGQWPHQKFVIDCRPCIY
jgi:hypothetical protein